MTLLAPLLAGIVAAVAIPSLLVLYFLKLRRQRRDIASTLLWQKAIEDLQVNAPFQRLRNSWLLWVQLLLLLVLLMALARPVLDASAIETGRAVILVDHSASMSARDAGAQVRLDRARTIAKELVDRLDVEDQSGRAMVLQYAARPAVLQTMTGQKSLLKEAVDRIEPTDEPTSLLPALRLVQPLAEQAAAAGTTMTIYIVSDGGSDQAEAVNQIDLKGARVVFVPVDPDGAQPLGNVAITAFSARRDPERPQRVALFAEIVNFSDHERRATVRFRVGDEVRRAQPVVLAAVVGDRPGREAVSLSLELPELAMVSVEHDARDALSADDRARLVLTAARNTSVLLVTEGNALMRHAIEAAGVERLTVGGLDLLETPAALEADVWVFDGLVPGGVPRRPSVFFGVVPGVTGLDLVEPEAAEPSSTRVLDWRRGHPLLRHVSLDDVVLRNAGRLVLPQGASVLATSPSGPLMAELRVAGQRHVLVGFDPLRSSWPQSIGFPVFFDNALRYLALGAEGTGELATRTGQAWTVPVSRVQGGEVVYDGPQALRAVVEGGGLVLPPAQRVGLYRTEAEVDPAYRLLAVNLLDPAESDLSLPAGDAEAGGEARQTAEITVPMEVWPWLLSAGLGLLMLEWVLYAWRTRV
ncbi:MAG: vWA domain-containing protein [Phycisphaeraceae bacterium]